jgi:hypothetical protein
MVADGSDHDPSGQGSGCGTDMIPPSAPCALGFMDLSMPCLAESKQLIAGHPILLYNRVKRPPVRAKITPPPREHCRRTGFPQLQRPGNMTCIVHQLDTEFRKQLRRTWPGSTTVKCHWLVCPAVLDLSPHRNGMKDAQMKSKRRIAIKGQQTCPVNPARRAGRLKHAASPYDALARFLKADAFVVVTF